MTITLELEASIVERLTTGHSGLPVETVLTEALYEMGLLRSQRDGHLKAPVSEEDLMSLWGVGWEGDLDAMRNDEGTSTEQQSSIAA